MFWKFFQSRVPHPDRNQASALPIVAKSHSPDHRAGHSIVPSQKSEVERRKSYRLVDLKEICAQSMAHDTGQLPVERIMNHKLLSHSVVQTVTIIRFFLSILHWATGLKIWLSLCKEWVIRLPLAVCKTEKNSVMHLQLFFIAENLYLGIQIYRLSKCMLEQFDRLSSPAACPFSLPEVIAPTAETIEWLAHYVHCWWPGASILAYIINWLGYEHRWQNVLTYHSCWTQLQWLKCLSVPTGNSQIPQVLRAKP